MPPNYKLNKIKSFKITHRPIPSLDDSTKDLNNYVFESEIDDHTKIQGLLKHHPRINLKKGYKPGSVSILGIGMQQRRANPYKHPEFPLEWEPKDWDEARNTLSTGHLRELIHNVRETFPDIESIKGYRITGTHAKQVINKHNITSGLQEIRFKPKK